MKMTHAWFPRLILGLSLYTLATGASLAQQLATVDCSTQSIQAAINAATPGGTLIVTVNGICNENVLIDRDDVTLQNGTNGGVTGTDPNLSSIEVRGANRVWIYNLTVSNGAGQGIKVSRNGDVHVQSCTIQSNAGAGIVAAEGAFAFVDTNTVSLNGSYGVEATNTGTANLWDNTIISTEADPNTGATIGVFRNSLVIMGGNNTVINTTGTGDAIQPYHGSTFRQNGHATVSGNVSVGNESNADFRDADITGTVTANQNSVLRFRDQGSVPSNVTVTGEVFVNESNVLYFSPLGVGTTINGTIHCNGGALFGKENVTGATLDCPAPIHVLRSDGTAKILVEELNAAVAPRNNFELINNGPVGFNMTDSNTSQTWRFAAQTTGFRVSLDGTGGPEMEVGNTGTLKVGPGGTQKLFLDASGNLSIAGSLSQSSDRNAKTHITALNSPEILTKLTTLPISQWAYKHTPTVTHLGPTAQDFHAAFGLGADDKHIAPGDLASVAVVGVQALNETLQQEIRTQEAEIAKRDTTITEQQREIAELAQRLAALETALNRVRAAQGSLHLAAVQTDQHH